MHNIHIHCVDKSSCPPPHYYICVVSNAKDKRIQSMSVLTPAQDQTATWRTSQQFYKGGKRNQCEIYQIEQLEMHLGTKLEKTNDRIHRLTLQIVDLPHPNVREDGFEFTENFDRVMCNEDGSPTTYFNFKMVSGDGGAQTRYVKDVYSFVHAQLEYVKRCHDLREHRTIPMFVNILDGDHCAKHYPKFTYILTRYPENVQRYIYVGDLFTYVYKIRPPLSHPDNNHCVSIKNKE